MELDEVKDLITALEMARATGKTYNLANACRQANGTLICANQRQATELKGLFQINTVTVSANLRGSRGPFFIDNFAVTTVLLRLVNAIQEKEEEIKKCYEIINNKP